MSENTHKPDDTLALWRQVETTPKNVTSPARLDGRNITTVDPTYLTRKATELFGPVGIGWGYVIEDERFDAGAPIFQEGVVVAHEKQHVIRLRLWYEWNGKRGEVTQYGHTPALYYVKGKGGGQGYIKTDGDPAKKSLTDALKKALSMLGFAADIYAGLYDDADYTAIREAEARLAKADEYEEEIQANREAVSDWFKRESAALFKVPHPRSIETMRDNMLNRLADKARLARYSQEEYQAVEKAIRGKAKDAIDALVGQGAGQ